MYRSLDRLYVENRAQTLFAEFAKKKIAFSKLKKKKTSPTAVLFLKSFFTLSRTHIYITTVHFIILYSYHIVRRWAVHTYKRPRTLVATAASVLVIFERTRYLV